MKTSRLLHSFTAAGTIFLFSSLFPVIGLNGEAGASTEPSMHNAEAEVTKGLPDNSVTSSIVAAGGAHWFAVAAEPKSPVGGAAVVSETLTLRIFKWSGDAWRVASILGLSGAGPYIQGTPIKTESFKSLEEPTFVIQSDFGDSAAVSVVSRISGIWRAIPFRGNGNGDADSLTADGFFYRPDSIETEGAVCGCPAQTFGYSNGRFQLTSNSAASGKGGREPKTGTGESWTLSDSKGQPFTISDIKAVNKGRVGSAEVTTLVFGKITNDSSEIEDDLSFFKFIQLIKDSDFGCSVGSTCKSFARVSGYRSLGTTDFIQFSAPPPAQNVVLFALEPGQSAYITIGWPTLVGERTFVASDVALAYGSEILSKSMAPWIYRHGGAVPG